MHSHVGEVIDTIELELERSSGWGAILQKKVKWSTSSIQLNRTNGASLSAAASSIPEAREKAIRENQAWPRAWLDNEEYKEQEQNKKCETNKQTNKIKK